jgi:hypothetical protein
VDDIDLEGLEGEDMQTGSSLALQAFLMPSHDAPGAPCPTRRRAHPLG